MQPENVMLEDRTACRVKIIDFGLARRLIPGQQLCVVQGTPDFVGELSSSRYVMCSYALLCYVMLYNAMLCSLRSLCVAACRTYIKPSRKTYS